MNRRVFLGGIAATGAASMLMSRRAFSAAPNDKVVVGVMGLSRGRALADQFAKEDNVEVKYVCDVDKERAASGAKLVEGAVGRTPEPITDFRRILDDKAIDALICAAPNHWHAPATILACSADKHVYVEKPCCHNPHEGELMVEAARQSNRAVQMGSQRRSGPGTREAISRLHEGVVGRIYMVKAWYNSARGSIGKGKLAEVPANLDFDLWQGPAPRKPYMDNVVPYNWHWFWHWGNGELGNNGVHTLDLCRWGLNVDYPIRVTSSGGRYCFDDDQQTPDTHVVSYEFPAKQMICWEGLSCHQHERGFITFFGYKGALDLQSNGSYTILDDKDKAVEQKQSTSLGDREHIVNFLEAIRGNKPLSLNAEIAEGYKSTLLCHLGNMAHRTGRTLRCDATNGKVLDDADAMALWQREYEPGWEPKV
jgi:predicted dehydrogenase